MLPMSAYAAVVLALALTSSSCRIDALSSAHDPLSPMGLTAEASVTTGASTVARDPVDPIHAIVPEITHLRADARRDTLYIRGQLRPRSRENSPFYGPTTLGGWSLQVFLDTDPAHSIYWRGYDYVVRGVEWTPASNSFVTRQITLDSTTPGGWGPQSGVALFVQRPREFQIAIPLRAVGGIERDVSYCVETYATIPCPACDGRLTQEWADDYFATLPDARHHPPFAGMAAPRTMGYAALLAPLPRHNADADPRLASQLPTDR